ncbi:hypothetical protein Tco_0411545, partial [Tanacetum coccineum]
MTLRQLALSVCCGTLGILRERSWISVDILSNTNFFQAFTASANVPAIYLQQFWNTMKYNEKTGVYRRDQTPHDSTTGPSSQPEDDTSEKVIHESSSTSDSERTERVSIPVSVPEKDHEALAGPDPEPMKNLDDSVNFGDQFLHDKPTEDDQEKSKAKEESDSMIPDPSHQTITSTPPVIAPFTNVTSSEPSSLVTPPPINTEATTIITTLP